MFGHAAVRRRLTSALVALCLALPLAVATGSPAHAGDGRILSGEVFSSPDPVNDSVPNPSDCGSDTGAWAAGFAPSSGGAQGVTGSEIACGIAYYEVTIEDTFDYMNVLKSGLNSTSGYSLWQTLGARVDMTSRYPAASRQGFTFSAPGAAGQYTAYTWPTTDWASYAAAPLGTFNRQPWVPSAGAVDVRNYPTIGAGWRDALNYYWQTRYVPQICYYPPVTDSLGNVLSPGGSYDCSYWVQWKVYTGRSITWWPVRAPGPLQQNSRKCASSVSNAYIEGPQLDKRYPYPSTRANAVTVPFPVQKSSGVWDQTTLMHHWNVVPYSLSELAAQGLTWDAATWTVSSQVARDLKADPTDFPVTQNMQKWDTPAVSHFYSCQPIKYDWSANPDKGATCKPIWDTSKYGAYPSTWTYTNDCGQIDGNFWKQAEGYQIICRTNQPRWPSVQGTYGHRTIVDCRDKNGNFTNDPSFAGQVLCTSSTCSPHTYSWFCGQSDGDGWNDTQDFMKSPCKPTPGITCAFPGGDSAPKIMNPDTDVVIKNGSQMVVNGKQWKITFPIPSLQVSGGTLVNPTYWQQWVSVNNSKPVNPVDPQPVFGSFDKAASPSTGAVSIINQLYETFGTDGWASRTLYLRGYRGAPMATSNYTFGAELDGYGQVQTPNAIQVKSGDVMPYGLYEAFNYSGQATSNTYTGGPVVTSFGGWCRTKMAYMYMVGGRAASNG